MSTNLPTFSDTLNTTEKPRILIIDDDETFQKMLELIADRLEVKAHMASCCLQALEAMRTTSFDLILMDYRMPNVDGFSCTHRIRAMKKLKSGIPIIAVTAHILPEHRATCLEAGMDDLLSKPFTFEELNEKLNYWLRRSAAS